MKKFLLLIALFFGTQMQANAFENYLILSNNEISAISDKNDGIISVSSIITLSGGKFAAVVKCQKEGETQFEITSGDNSSIFSVTVEKDKSKISDQKGYTIITLDLPPDLPDFDKPPLLKTTKKDK